MYEAKTKATVSSGNVFADLGFDNPEEELLKARLASLVNRAIETRGWTQKETAKILGIKQPHVSELARGRLARFSVERLLYFLSMLEHRITITINDETKTLPSEKITITKQHDAGYGVRIG
jgi:predicted XRE-type DNA-binding protein